MSYEFSTPIDIANRALQHLGSIRIDPVEGFHEDSRRASEIGACYDKLRIAELRRNIWRFATRRAVLRPINALALGASPFTLTPQVSGAAISPSMLIAPGLWSPVTTYPLGALVTDQDRSIWQSLAPANLGNEPGSTTVWEEYCGPMTADYFDSANLGQSSTQQFAYYAGELVYNFKGTGDYTVYQSLTNANAQPPTVPMPWQATQVYAMDETAVVYPAYAGGTTYAAGAAVIGPDLNYYGSLVGGNIGHTPASSPAQWAPFPASTVSNTGQTVTAIPEWSQVVAYTAGSFVDFGGLLYLATSAPAVGALPSAGGSWVALSGGVLYQSLVDLNLNNPPASSASQWSTTITSGAGSNQWKTLGVALQPLGLMYPLGSGPTWQSTTRNAYRLPAAYLRRAPLDSKAGQYSWLGAPANLLANDWELQGDYFTSALSTPIVFPFIANVTQVRTFDPMFCEGLAARIAYETCEVITQSTAKQQVAAAAYRAAMGEARLTNAIDVGSVEPPLDDWIACRI